MIPSSEDVKAAVIRLGVVDRLIRSEFSKGSKTAAELRRIFDDNWPDLEDARKVVLEHPLLNSMMS